MAPQQELEQLLSPETRQPDIGEDSGGGEFSSEENISANSNDEAHVIIVQPDEESSNSSKSKKKGKGKKSKGGGGEAPLLPVPGGRGLSKVEQVKNCRHLETALFLFGIAGMIVSMLMLLHHFVRNLVPYY